VRGPSRFECRRCLLLFGQPSVVARSLKAGENGAGWHRRGGIATTAAFIDLMQGKIGEAESASDAPRLNFELARPSRG
jgi:hypothetical protein